MDDNKRLLLFIKDLLNDPHYAKKILDAHFVRKDPAPPPTTPQDQTGYENIRDTAYKTTTFKSLGDIVITNTELEQAKQTVKAENAVKYGSAPAKVTTVQTPPYRTTSNCCHNPCPRAHQRQTPRYRRAKSLISPKDIPHPALNREIGLCTASNGCQPNRNLVDESFETVQKKQGTPPSTKTIDYAGNSNRQHPTQECVYFL